MRYWWVNQNQTARQEWAGGYLWSPKRKANDARNPFYEFMREVAPGDLILAFADTHVRRIGIAQSYAYECPKPAEFGAAGPNWNKIGWKVDVRYLEPARQLRPADHMAELAPLLPAHYAPLRANGHGLQSVYLTTLPEPLMQAFARLIGPPLGDLMRERHVHETAADAGAGFWEWERYLEEDVRRNTTLTETERAQLIMARRGQGRFKQNVRLLESRCRVTGVDRLEHLRASHIKPWREATNEERLDGENGFLLTPTIDHLFDRGFISFENNGHLIVSPAAHRPSLERMGLVEADSINVGRFTEGQRNRLEFHRENVFLEARGGRR